MFLACAKMLLLISGISASLQNHPHRNLPPARQMALAILEEAKSRPEPMTKLELESAARTKSIINEVSKDYLNISRKLKELKREEGRLHSLQKRIKRRRRTDLLHNLRKHYTS